MAAGKRKSKHATGKPFSIEVCDAIRHHVGESKALKSKRENAFGDRDAALSKLNQLESKDSKEAVELKARHSDAVVQIVDLDHRIKWHGKQIDELVDKADQPQLDFMYDIADQEAHDAKVKAEKAAEKAKAKSQPTKAEADSGVAEGVDEHLRASVNELDCRENIKGKLIAAGLTTIGAVVKIVDGGDGEVQNLRDLDGIGDVMAEEIEKAVKAYRKKHRRAAREAEAA